MTPEEMQATLAIAKLTMVRYRNALMAIRQRAAKDGQADIARLAAKALREPDADR
jgi:hypothetical protein